MMTPADWRAPHAFLGVWGSFYLLRFARSCFYARTSSKTSYYLVLLCRLFRPAFFLPSSALPLLLSSWTSLLSLTREPWSLDFG